MRILREHLLLCTLFALLSGNVADSSPSYDGIFMQNQDVSQDDDSNNYRLPTNVKPTAYDIKLIPNLENSTFIGYAKIEAIVESTTNNITLHVGNLNVKEVHVSAYASTAGPSSSYDSDTDKYTIFLTKTYEKGKQLEISFTYTGNISDNMIGFYKSSYFDENGQIKWLLATQFETTHARHVFPCFDEPSFKANFTIRISRGNNYKSLSNMPLEGFEKLPEQPEGKSWDTFYPSIPMSTYLVAFVVSEFDSLGGDKFKVWSRPSTANQRDYALQIGTAALELFEAKFNQNYTLPKMDMVAVPDFAAGAMENWGLVTYRESRLLYDEKESSVTAQQSVAATIVHELTHMWFGNLVTPEWWGYLWLSEGFATYFQYFGTAELQPTWNMKDQFVIEQHQSALIADSLESSLPMSREVSSESQIAGIADTITYNKAASIIRMMSHIFGAEIFDKSLNSYIENNQEDGLATPDALWEAIKDQIENEPSYPNIDVKAKMDTWTKQAGYPIVTISVNDNGVLNLSQKRFLLRNWEKTSKDTIWSIPLTFTTESEPNFSDTIPKYWMSAKENTIDYGIDPKKWVIFNVQSSGFYRVNYNNRGWQNIFNVLKSDQFNDIHELNRAGIVDDLLNLGRAEYLNYDLVLNGLLYLQKETNYLPFKAAFNGLEYLHKRFTGYTELAFFKVYVLSLIENIHVKLGYEELETDDRFTILLRREVNNWLCNFDDEECVTTYTEKFKQWRADTNARIKPNDRTTAYCVAIRHGTSEDWEFLWKEYLASNNAADQTVILNALGCSRNTTILETYLKNAITNYENSRIRKHDSTSVFAAVYNSGLPGAEYILDFVEKYHKEMEDYYGGQSTIATILDGASQRLSTQDSVDKFEDFIVNHNTDFESIQKSLNYSLTVAKHELEWYKTFSTPIIKWLEEYDKLSSRLPMDIIPKKYTISLTPYLDDFHVDGKVLIEADVTQPTCRIILHSSEITIRNDVKVTADQKRVNIFKQKHQDRYDFLVIYLAAELTAGTKLTVEIEYTGHLNATELRGFYKSSYVNEEGKTRWLAASHLEPVGARKMFPCFDEPALKATFVIQVNVSQDYQPISNMGWQAMENIGDHTSYTFFESKSMSTYLVAVIVSDFESNSIQTDQIKINVYARPNAINQTDYALSMISPLVKFFETTYKQNYQLPKLSMAALPDFPSGAMENWGLLTYRETSMLYDENHSPITNKQDIRNVIAHEISHQWFGNLVTPVWWTYLWLNEGFARYFEYYAPARVFDDKTMEPQFVVDQVHSAFRADSFKSVHPLSHDVTTPREIRSIFDTITYAKGGSILRMIEKAYGTDVFDSALSDYLDKRKYNVTEPKDLYASLQLKITDKGLKGNIRDILDTWTTQPGYPVIDVDVTKNFIFMKQNRFFLKQHEATFDNTTWNVPITWTSVQNSSKDSDTRPKLWLTKRLRRENNPSDSLLIFNTQQSGYYRVNYNRQHWSKLIDYLRNQDFETIHEINRAALIDDLMNLARAEYIDYKTLVSATKYLVKETSYFPWRAFFNNLPYLNNRFAGRDIEGLYKKWLTVLIEQLYTRLTFEDNATDADLTKMLRIHARKWACKLDIADCVFNAANYFQQKQHSKPIPPNYRDTVYCTAMRMDKTTNSYKFLWDEYLKSTVTTDKLVILNSLACSENKEVLETLLKAAITENSPIRYQDSAKVFSSVYDASSIGVEAVMKVIETSYDDILHRNFDDYTKIAEIVSALANRLSTRDLYDQYRKLLDWLVNKEPEFKKFINSYLATAEYEFDWYERNVPAIFETLDSQFLSLTYRLPETLYPKLYNVYLTPYMKKGFFIGKVEIHMTVREDTTLIALNFHKLDILNVTVVRNGTSIKLLNMMERAPQQFGIYLSKYVHTNEEIVAEIEFNGTLTDNMNGFYRSSYHDIKGVQHWLATTQFEPTYARQAFPCFDEPAFKSRFAINIRRQENYKSLSNMPRKPEGNNSESDVWDTFYTSNVNMSTYLVAFVVSEFQPVFDPKKVTINVWGRPEVAKYGEYAQNISVQLIDELQNITGIDYALPKLDLVGIPDFSNGAMENWGLATFREYGLFYDEEETTATSEKNIISIIAHELTHMWFGNLVTCDWWDYIWLNEGFAQYFEWAAADRIRPEYKFMDQFVVYELQPALAKDASLSVHPMTNPVNTPEEIAGIFDYVAYGKAASILRMVFNAFDNDTHISSALHDYLTKRMYLTARPTHLWKSLEPYVSISIGNRKARLEEVMNTWTDQPGYPIVHASIYGSMIELTQERFLDGSPFGNEFYWIPVDVFIASDVIVDNNEPVKRRVWLGPKAERIFINPNNDWFIVNYKQTGFYRVNYDTSVWQSLINKLNNTEFEAINVINRAQIIDDLFNLAHAKYVTYELLMNATMYLKQETNHLPWKAFFNGLSYMHRRFEQEPFQQNLNKYFLNLVSDIYDKIGFYDHEDDQHLDKLNRELILQWACKLNKTECIKTSVDLFTAWRNNSTERIPPNARPAVYCAAIKEGSAEDWYFLWNQYLKTNFATEKKIIINALGCSTNTEILQNYLARAIDKSDPGKAAIRRQDVSAVFASVYNAGPIGVNVTLNYSSANVFALYNYYKNWKDVADLFVNVAPYISNEGQYKQLENFLEYYIYLFPPDDRERLRSAMTTAEANLLWFKDNSPEIRDWILKLEGPEIEPKPGSSTRIESLSIVLTTLVALISYLLSR